MAAGRDTGAMSLPGLEDAAQSLFFPSHGPQSDSTKRSNATWTMPKATIAADKQLYMSEKHNQDSLGRASPGPKYTPKRQKHDPKWGFGTAAQRPPQAKAKYPEMANDLLGTIPDSQQFKYSQSAPIIGIANRMAPSNAPDIDTYPLGMHSPGPQRYKPERAAPCHRFSWAPDVDQVAPKYTMRPKTKRPEDSTATPARVGPGSYPHPESIGRQDRSEKPTLPTWGINKVDRFPRKVQHGDAGRLWDGQGNMKSKFSRSCSLAPSFGFGTSKRFPEAKITPNIQPKDKGPAAVMGKPRADCPNLPLTKDIAKYGPTGAPP